MLDKPDPMPEREIDLRVRMLRLVADRHEVHPRGRPPVPVPQPEPGPRRRRHSDRVAFIVSGTAAVVVWLFVAICLPPVGALGWLLWPGSTN